VPVRGKVTADLDVQGVSITSGRISLHDDDLPLRRLGTGSARLIVSALQHDAGPPHVAIIDEIEHGLETHRIARLLIYLKAPKAGGAGPAAGIRNHAFSSGDPRVGCSRLISVRSHEGITAVKSISALARDSDTAQNHLRGNPEAFSRSQDIGGRRTYGTGPCPRPGPMVAGVRQGLVWLAGHCRSRRRRQGPRCPLSPNICAILATTFGCGWIWTKSPTRRI
jgi:putative ATP-dependent endonuclease of OLD family